VSDCAQSTSSSGRRPSLRRRSGQVGFVGRDGEERFEAELACSFVQIFAVRDVAIGPQDSDHVAILGLSPFESGARRREPSWLAVFDCRTYDDGGHQIANEWCWQSLRSAQLRCCTGRGGSVERAAGSHREALRSVSRPGG